jgi:methyl-accepting chemotaxis protein
VRGLDRINLAVSEMNKVTQQSAADAEESASAAEEMNSQAEQMQQFVQELRGVVVGTSAGSTKDFTRRAQAVSLKEKFRSTLPRV